MKTVTPASTATKKGEPRQTIARTVRAADTAVRTACTTVTNVHGASTATKKGERAIARSVRAATTAVRKVKTRVNHVTPVSILMSPGGRSVQNARPVNSTMHPMKQGATIVRLASLMLGPARRNLVRFVRKGAALAPQVRHRVLRVGLVVLARIGNSGLGTAPVKHVPPGKAGGSTALCQTQPVTTAPPASIRTGTTSLNVLHVPQADIAPTTWRPSALRVTPGNTAPNQAPPTLRSVPTVPPGNTAPRALRIAPIVLGVGGTVLPGKTRTQAARLVTRVHTPTETAVHAPTVPSENTIAIRGRTRAHRAPQVSSVVSQVQPIIPHAMNTGPYRIWL